MRIQSRLPKDLGVYNFDLKEVMYYLYLPVAMHLPEDIRLPPNVAFLLNAVRDMQYWTLMRRGRLFDYVYLSARKGWATPDNPLNRPGWHADGYGTDDLNFVWWRGSGTRFAVQDFHGLGEDHAQALQIFEEQVKEKNVRSLPEKHFYLLDSTIVHSTPIIPPPGEMRQYIKISMSDHQYNLENNSHNYLFNYSWPLQPRDVVRNDPHRSMLDYSPKGK